MRYCSWHPDLLRVSLAQALQRTAAQGYPGPFKYVAICSYENDLFGTGVDDIFYVMLKEVSSREGLYFSSKKGRVYKGIQEAESTAETLGAIALSPAPSENGETW